MIPRYYEFLNKLKIMSGFRALENIPHELKSRGSERPMLITRKELIDQGLLRGFVKSMSDSEMVVGSVFLCPEPVTPERMQEAISEYKEHNCDAIIALGDGIAFKLGQDIINALGHSIVFITVPAGFSGTEITGSPDIVILDPKMSRNLPPRDTAIMAMDTISNAIEAYTCLQKNPISDAYSFSAVNLVRENLEPVLKNWRNRRGRLALANSALLSGIALMNSHAGIVHALAYGITATCGIPHADAVGIVLPHCMDFRMIKLDEYYGELLLPLAGAEIYADTLLHERGRKTVRIIRNMLSEYHRKYNIPVCLSEVGTKRSDFDKIASASLKSSPILYDPAEVNEDEIKNILNLAF